VAERRLLLPDFVDGNVAIVLGSRLAMSGARAIAGVVTALYLARLGFSGFRIGLVFLGVALASAAMSTVIGFASDRIGRKPFLVAIPLLAALAALGFGFSRTPAVLFVLAALGSFGRGAGAGGGSVGPYQPAESAFIAEAVPAADRSAAFGRLSVASSLGALAGGLLAGLARPAARLSPVGVTAAYRPAFLAAAALAGLAGLVALGLREPRQLPSRPKGRRIAETFRWPRRSWPALWRLWITNGTNGLAIGAFGPFVAYWLHRRYGVGPATVGELFAAVNFATLVSGFLAAGAARRFGTVRAIVAVRAITAVLLVPMVEAPSFLIAGAVFLVRMLIQRIGLPLRQSYTQDLAHPDERASMAALSNLPAQATMAGSQVLAGYLFDEVSLASPFEVAAFFQAANAALYWLLFERFSPKRHVLDQGAAAVTAPQGGLGEPTRVFGDPPSCRGGPEAPILER
jgi:MFS family permease